jgi:hypothetical protein
VEDGVEEEIGGNVDEEEGGVDDETGRDARGEDYVKEDVV